MDPNPYKSPEGPSTPKSVSTGYVAVTFVAGTVLAWLLSGAYYMHALDGVELHPDGGFMGAVCLLCPLVGLLAALVTWRIGKRRK